jgi:hypothetical protein
VAVNALKIVDSPTFGKPTIPQRKPIPSTPCIFKAELKNFTCADRIFFAWRQANSTRYPLSLADKKFKK